MVGRGGDWEWAANLQSTYLLHLKLPTVCHKETWPSPHINSSTVLTRETDRQTDRQRDRQTEEREREKERKKKKKSNNNKINHSAVDTRISVDLTRWADGQPGFPEIRQH